MYVTSAGTSILNDYTLFSSYQNGSLESQALELNKGNPNTVKLCYRNGGGEQTESKPIPSIGSERLTNKKTSNLPLQTDTLLFLEMEENAENLVRNLCDEVDDTKLYKRYGLQNTITNPVISKQCKKTFILPYKNERGNLQVYLKAKHDTKENATNVFNSKIDDTKLYTLQNLKSVNTAKTKTSSTNNQEAVQAKKSSQFIADITIGANARIEVISNNYIDHFCFQGIDKLCHKTKHYIKQPESALIQLQSQGVPWVIKTFIMSATRVSESWKCLHELLEKKQPCLEPIEREYYASNVSRNFQVWQTTSKALLEQISHTFQALDRGLQMKQQSYKKSEVTASAPQSDPTQGNCQPNKSKCYKNEKHPKNQTQKASRKTRETFEVQSENESDEMSLNSKIVKQQLFDKKKGRRHGLKTKKSTPGKKLCN